MSYIAVREDSLNFVSLSSLSIHIDNCHRERQRERIWACRISHCPPPFTPKATPVELLLPCQH